MSVVVDAIKELQKPKWIPVSDPLLEEYKYEDVLVWFEYYRYGEYNRLFQTHGIGTYCGETRWMINHETGWEKLRVIAWQPLPEEPKEEVWDGNE